MKRQVTCVQRHPRWRVRRFEAVRAVRLLDERFGVGEEDWGALPGGSGERLAAGGALVAEGRLTVVWMTDGELAELHRQFLGDPSTTDVITFCGDSLSGEVGTICVSVDRAAWYAEWHRATLGEELLRYLVHGWLHLAGYDDLVPEKRRQMRAAEERALKLLAGG